MRVLTASPRACSISLWSLSPGPMCLRAKSSCLGRRRSRRREAPAPPLSPPPLLLSRLCCAQRGPAPPARRRPPATPQLRRSPQALAHVCMVAPQFPAPDSKSQLRSRPVFWSRSPRWWLPPAWSPFPEDDQRNRLVYVCSGAMNGSSAKPGHARKVVAKREAPARHTLSVALGAGGGMGPANVPPMGVNEG